MSDYAFEGPKWASSTITWSFAAAGGDFSNAITGAYQATIRAAVARWAQVTNLTFKEVPDSATVNIRVGFGQFSGTQVGETDYRSFGSSGQARTFLAGTTVQLEDPASRPIGTAIGAYYQGTSTTLYQTMLHEFGHALGLDHSTNAADVMYASIGPGDNDLGAADIQGIQLLYGVPAGAPAASTASTVSAGVVAPITAMAVNIASAAVGVYRFFDTSSGTQFLTASVAERNDVIATRHDLTYEGLGLGGIAPGADQTAVPVFRFFDTTSGTHFFTASQSEARSLAATRSDLVLEQTTFYEHATEQTGDVPVYRFFDKTDGTHFYTASGNERAVIASTRTDMTYEGVAFYAPSAV